ncbi:MULTISPECIES: outer membrane protein transport protein [unclassified Photobacterium]|uniref:outer membrane protein transport protein n=1 Tax=unclassified Photobacterium TaxID=2628852 RepID=UPI001EDDEA5D|nr:MULTISPECIES: outer membrane protein transport protein [unclassified Photobacterium]MCG3862542.1 outer membrane protein transport protein [Photobacterium sp. Ph6]MCG3873959.1 outer membrane protein transport protein [Photobacterium sp. Ph5]
MNKNKITLSLTAAVALGISTNALAAGFQLAEYSATGLGRAFAGEAAMADNASAQFRNPAMLTYLKGTQISTGAIYVDPNVDVKGNLQVNGRTIDQTEARNIAHSAVIPNFYISRQLNNNATLGLAFGTNFGMRTDLGTDFTASIFGNQAEVHTVEINPNIGYKINDQFSVGAGVRYIMAKGHFGAALPSTLPTMVSGMLLPKQKYIYEQGLAGKNLKYMEGEDNAWGWQAGAAWQINPTNRIGVSYRSAVDLNLSGHASGIAFGGNTLPGSLPLELPASAEIASFHQLNDQWSVHASINWTDWSSFKKLEANIPSMGGNVEIKPQNWKDNYRFAIGTTYQATEKLALRSGIAYDMAAVDEAHRTQTIPETDRTWLSLGAGYQWSKNLTLDAGLTYVYAKKAHLNETDKNINALASMLTHPKETKVSFAGTTSGDVWLAGVQASYRF